MAAITGATIGGIALWKLLLAAGLIGGGAKMGTDLALGLRGYGVQSKAIEAGLKSKELLAAAGRREERRMNDLMTKLVAHTSTQKAKTQEFEILKMLLGSIEGQQNLAAMLTSQKGPARTGFVAPSGNIASLLR